MLAFLLKLLDDLPLALVILASLIGRLRFRRLPPSLRYLTLLTCFYVVLESSGKALMLLKIHNLFLIPVAVVGEFWLLTLVYKHALRWPAYNKVAPWLVGLLTAYVLVDSLLAFEAARFKPSLQVINDLFNIALAALYFRGLLNELQVKKLRRDPMFWVSTALLIFALGDLFIALFSNYLLAHYSNQMNLYVWKIHSLLLVLLYGSYCYALWMRPQR